MSYTFPEPLLASLRQLPGFREKEFLDAHYGGCPVVSLRMHPLKPLEPHWKNTQPIPWCSTGFYLQERPSFTLDPAFHAGAYYVQEASSMFTDYLIRQILPQLSGLRVLDLCAAPGGKTTLLASLLDADSLLVSNEVIHSRVPILLENVVRWGYPQNWVSRNDPAEFEKLPGFFDMILVDAPCSGSGLFRKKPEHSEAWSQDLVDHCAARQKRIVHAAWKALAEGGWLVYATCSFSPEENEAILDELASHYEVKQNYTLSIPESWQIMETESAKHQLKGYRFFPDRLQGEGFFIAAVQKMQGEKKVKPPRYKSLHQPAIAKMTTHLLTDNRHRIYMQGQSGAFCIDAQHEEDWHLLQSCLHLKKAGTLLGEAKHKEWIPDHALALSVEKHTDVPQFTLDKEQALRYLSKQDLAVDIPAKGWYIATYKGLGIGWFKSLGNRINNYLPSSWKIRMDIRNDMTS